jgi:AcrR family transcriptional regulator
MRRDRRPRQDQAPRAEQKEQTRRALLDAALRLLADKSFDGLSLREVTREVGVVPAAFYRHFESLEELGLVLVDESFRTLRRLMRAAREGPLPHTRLVRRSVETFVFYVQAHRPHFQFLVRERFGGVASIRSAIRSEIRLFVSELATDLGRFPELSHFGTEDLQMLAGLIVSIMIAATEHVLERPAERPDAEEVIRLAEKQLRFVVLATPHWKCSSSAATPGAEPRIR